MRSIVRETLPQWLMSKVAFARRCWCRCSRNDELIGVLGIGRQRLEPFTEKEIELVTDFAAEAAIALEIVRRERQLREVQMELAHASRVATMGQLTGSVSYSVKEPNNA